MAKKQSRPKAEKNFKDDEMARGFSDFKSGNKSGRNRGSKNGRRNAQRDESGNKPVGRSNSFNSINWWARLPELLRAVSAIPYPYKPGMTLAGPTVQAEDHTGAKYDKDTEYVMPGIATLNFSYSIGYSNHAQDPASICCARLYERVRATYSGTLKADATDMFMYIFALDQIHAYIAWLKRLYRTLNLYTPENRLFPQALFDAQLGYGSVTDGTFVRFLQQKPNFEFMINQLVRMANNWYAPADMDIFERHRWMNEHVYLDAPTLAGQVYLLNPGSFFKIGNDPVTMATRMDRATPDFSQGKTPEALFQFGFDLIESLAHVGNAYDMKGYFEKSYAGTPSYLSELLMPEEVLVPVFVPEVLGQFHNLTVIDGYTPTPITQDKLSHTIIHTPTDSKGAFKNRVILDSYSPAPDIADTVLNTRLTACTRSAREGEGGQYRLTCGTEVITSIWLCLGKYDRYEMLPVPTEITYDAIGGPAYMNGMLDDIRRLLDTRAWAGFPRMTVRFAFNDENGHVYVDGQGRVTEQFLTVSEMNNPTTVDWETLNNMNKVCLFSVFNCFRTSDAQGG